MKKIRNLLRRAFTSITIAVIPHDSHRSVNVRIPAIGAVAVLLLSACGSGYLLFLAVSGLHYKSQHYELAKKVEYYNDQFNKWDSTVTALKTVEKEFQRIFSYKTKDQVLEHVDTSFIGSVEIPDLIGELQKTIESVEEIQEYLSAEQDDYLATPKGYPVNGRISSKYGKRTDPFTGEITVHSGIDIPSSLGLPVKATANGIVSHSGWTRNSGYVVVIEHGCGFTTLYAHNKKNNVKVGDKVKRGDVIGYVGSTGKSTGPHVHYEVWKDGKTVDPKKYLTRSS